MDPPGAIAVVVNQHVSVAEPAVEHVNVPEESIIANTSRNSKKHAKKSRKKKKKISSTNETDDERDQSENGSDDEVERKRSKSKSRKSSKKKSSSSSSKKQSSSSKHKDEDYSPKKKKKKHSSTKKKKKKKKLSSQRRKETRNLDPMLPSSDEASSEDDESIQYIDSTKYLSILDSIVNEHGRGFLPSSSLSSGEMEIPADQYESDSSYSTGQSSSEDSDQGDTSDNNDNVDGEDQVVNVLVDRPRSLPDDKLRTLRESQFQEPTKHLSSPLDQLANSQFDTDDVVFESSLEGHESPLPVVNKKQTLVPPQILTINSQAPGADQSTANETQSYQKAPIVRPENNAWISSNESLPQDQECEAKEANPAQGGGNTLHEKCGTTCQKVHFDPVVEKQDGSNSSLSVTASSTVDNDDSCSEIEEVVLQKGNAQNEASGTEENKVFSRIQNEETGTPNLVSSDSGQGDEENNQPESVVSPSCPPSNGPREDPVILETDLVMRGTGSDDADSPSDLVEGGWFFGTGEITDQDLLRNNQREAQSAVLPAATANRPEQPLPEQASSLSQTDRWNVGQGNVGTPNAATELTSSPLQVLKSEPSFDTTWLETTSSSQPAESSPADIESSQPLSVLVDPIASNPTTTTTSGSITRFCHGLETSDSALDFSSDLHLIQDSSSSSLQNHEKVKKRRWFGLRRRRLSQQ